MKDLQYLADREEIIEVVNGIFINSDERHWPGVIECFDEKVVLDYTSMAGGEPATLSPAEIVELWKGLLPGFEATQHSISNHRIEIRDNKATCFSYGTALHYLPNESGQNLWTVVGTYDHQLTRITGGWKVTAMRFNLKFLEGNQILPQLAQKAVKRSKT